MRPDPAECPQGKPEGLLVGRCEGQLAHHLPLRGRGRPRRGPDRLPLMRGGAGRPPDIGGMRSAGRGRAGLIRKLTPPANGPAGLHAVPARLRRAIEDRARPATRRRPERAQPRSVLAPVREAPEALHRPDDVFRVRHHDHLLSFRLPGPGGCDTGPFRTAPALLAPTLDIPHVYRYMSHHRVVLHRHPDPRQLKEREPALDGEVIQWARDSVATLPLRGLG